MYTEILNDQLSVAARHGDPLITRSLGGPDGLQARIDSYQRPTLGRATVHEYLAALCTLQFTAGVVLCGDEWLSGENALLSLSQSTVAGLAIVNRRYSRVLGEPSTVTR